MKMHKRSLARITSVFALSLTACAFSPESAEKTETQMNPTQEVDVIILRKAGTPNLRPKDLGVGARVTRTYVGALNGYAAKVKVKDLDTLKQDPDTYLVEADGVAYATETRQLSTEMWGLDRIDQRLPARDLKYSYNYSGEGVDVFIVDTGITLTHPEFGGRAQSYWDYVNNDADATDDHGHGTHVAGTVGGSTVGVAPGVRLWATKVLSSGGWGTYSDIISAINDITQLKLNNPKMKIVGNMSLSGGQSAALDAAVNTSTAAGVVWAVAAGNSASDACAFSPAAAESALTVGAIGLGDQRTWFSNWGNCVDVFAPGLDIRSASMDGNYVLMSGTSMASPHVAGAAALYLSASPTATAQSTIKWVRENATQDIVIDPNGSPNRLLCTLGDEMSLDKLSVSDLDGYVTKRRRKRSHRMWSDPTGFIWKAELEVEVRDSHNNGVSQANVNVATKYKNYTCQTDQTGRCNVIALMTSDVASSVDFTVTDVQKPGYAYDPDNNKDPEGDSNGTTLTLNICQ